MGHYAGEKLFYFIADGSSCGPYGKHIEVSWRKGDKFQQEKAVLGPGRDSCGFYSRRDASSDHTFYICDDLFDRRDN